jgi:urease accessory protein
MHELIDKIQNTSETPITTLTLPLDRRQKSRQRVVLDNGDDAGIILRRGTVLFNNDLLISKEEKIVRVLAADELLSVVTCTDPLLFARACYHLGNRHMPLRIEKDTFYYLHDHVLDGMLSGMGLVVETVSAPFEPESGAYDGGTAKHRHEH